MKKLLIARVPPSAGARVVAKALNVRRVRPQIVNKFTHSLVVNWGTTAVASRGNQRVINHPQSVYKAVDKKVCLQLLKAAGVPCLEFTTNGQALREAYPKSILVARTLTKASGGKGIVIVRPGEAIVSAPLYTKYEKKRAEFRVHVGPGEFYHIQQKRRKTSATMDEDQKLVRSHDNGWVLCENAVNITAPERESLKTLAKAAIAALGLDFGAVDILQRKKSGAFVVCEINTAPGVEATGTRAHYATAFNALRNA